MNRTKLESIAYNMATRHEETARASSGVGRWTVQGSHHAGQAEAYAECAKMLLDFLKEHAASRDPLRPVRRDVRLPREAAILRGIDFGTGWGDPPREVPEAGPGLWRGIGLHADRGDYVITVEQVTP